MNSVFAWKTKHFHQKPSYSWFWNTFFMSVPLSRSVILLVTPMDWSCQAPLSIGILQARILEWVAMPSCKRYYQGLPHCRWILYHLSPQGRPWILQWVAYPFSRETSWPRHQTRVFCIEGRFFTSWATREALKDRVFFSEGQLFLVLLCIFLCVEEGWN